MNLLRKLFFPFVPLYFLITYLRNKLYDYNIIKSKSYPFPVICVGNLSVGGTGKSPMIEYLLRLLDEKRLATLSRGYRRKTKGFLLADDRTNVEDLGDEPYQFKQKFKDVLVAVDENRQRGIESLMKLENSPEVILLDDAFQHRKVKAGFNIMLTTYDNLYVDDFVLPTGNLREPKPGAKRADVVVVTKCPSDITKKDKSRISSKLKLESYQKLFFSSIVYDDYVLNNDERVWVDDLKNEPFTLVTGIANAQTLVDFLKAKKLNFEHLNFKDHHDFTEGELKTLDQKPLIVTTEKDFVRLHGKLKNVQLFYLPITVSLDDSEAFEYLVKKFVG